MTNKRIEKSWVVFKSLENQEHDRCVDFFMRSDRTFGFEEFRRDVEDEGRWTPVSYYSVTNFSSEESAVLAAQDAIRWFRERA
jgi:hypothetical protein